MGKDKDKKSNMKRTGFMKYGFYIILIIVTASITALIMVLATGEESKSKLQVEFEAEQVAALVVEEYLGGSLDDPAVIDPRIKGLGIYTVNGSKLFVWGSAPGSFTGQLQMPGGQRFVYSKDGSTITLIRWIGAPRMMRFMMRRNSGTDRGPQSLVYMVFDASGHLERSRSASFITLVIPFITILLMAVIAFLYAKNMQYRKKLASQSELEKLGEIARTLAHEIKNPLGAMQIHVGYLRKTLPAETHGELRVLDEEISRLNLLTHRISDFVRDPVGSPEDMDLASFIGEMAIRYKTNVGFEKKTGEACTVRFDRERLHSVIENLVTNGLESYGDQGNNPDARVEIVISREKGRVTLSIMDRGAGIVASDADKVFDPFFSTKTRGSGIGLAISKRFVESAGGSIELMARDGGGTVAKIAFRKEGKA